MMHHLVYLYQVCSNYAPGAKNDPPPCDHLFYIGFYRGKMKQFTCLEPQVILPWYWVSQKDVQIVSDELEVVASFCYFGDMLSRLEDVNLQQLRVWKPPGRSLRSCCLFFHPATFPTRPVVVCIDHVSGIRCFIQARLGPWQDQISSVYDAMTEPWSDRSVMWSLRMWLMPDRTSCWHDFRSMTSMLSWERKGFVGLDTLNDPVQQLKLFSTSR